MFIRNDGLKAAVWFGILLWHLTMFPGCTNDETTGSQIPGDTPPKVNSFTVSDPSPHVGNTVVLQVSASDDHGLNTVIILFGDSLSIEFNRRSQKNFSGAVTHAYPEVGTFTATVRVFDTESQTDSKSLTVTVSSETTP